MLVILSRIRIGEISRVIKGDDSVVLMFVMKSDEKIYVVDGEKLREYVRECEKSGRVYRGETKLWEIRDGVKRWCEYERGGRVVRGWDYYRCRVEVGEDVDRVVGVYKGREVEVEEKVVSGVRYSYFENDSRYVKITKEDLKRLCWSIL